jgi:hypothetical protein
MVRRITMCIYVSVIYVIVSAHFVVTLGMAPSKSDLLLCALSPLAAPNILRGASPRFESAGSSSDRATLTSLSILSRVLMGERETGTMVS